MDPLENLSNFNSDDIEDRAMLLKASKRLYHVSIECINVFVVDPDRDNTEADKVFKAVSGIVAKDLERHYTNLVKHARRLDVTFTKTRITNPPVPFTSRDTYWKYVKAINENLDSLVVALRGRPMGDFDVDCFVATAVFGDSNHPDVMALRKYRDAVLMESLPGRAFIKCYYLLGPPMGAWIRNKPRIKRSMRFFIAHIARRARKRTAGDEDR